MTPITDKLAEAIGVDLAVAQHAFSRLQALDDFNLELLADAMKRMAATLAAYAPQQAEPSDARVEAAAMALAEKDWHWVRLTDKERMPFRERARAVLQAADAVGAGAGWQHIETAPKDGRKMLLFYMNANGQARRVIGGWVTDEEAAETDEDGVGLEAGWYERIDNWPDYNQVAIHEGEPTHWMPLPAAPGSEKKEGA